MKRTIEILLLIGTIFTFAFGQEHTEGKADQALRGSGRVNASTLGMEFSFPMGSYSGRGINVPISLSYSSKLWRMNYSYDTEGTILHGGCRSVNEAVYSENSASGWTTSLAVPYIEYTGKNNLFNERGFPNGVDICPNAPPNNNQPAYIRRLTIHLPSGETHELRSDDAPEIFQFGAANDPSQQASWNRTYYSVDGSNIKYIEDSTTGVYRLQMPDGSHYDFAASQSPGSGGWVRNAVRFTDRNGNFTSYNSGTWTDTMGRTLSAPIGTTAPAAGTYNYAMPGMTGTYKFRWKQLKGATAEESGLTDFNQNLKYRGPHMHPTNNGNWALRPAGTYLFNSEFEHYVLSDTDLFNPVVLAEIELPTGQKYKFSYDIFGVIERISYPTGGEEKFVYSPVATLTKQEPDTVAWQANRGVVNRKVYPVPNGAYYEWTYAASHIEPLGYKVSTGNPDGTLSERYLHRGNDPCISCEAGNFGYDNALAGMPYETRGYDSGSPRKLLSHSITTWTSKTFSQQGIGVPSWHPRVVSEESRIYDTLGNGISTTTTIGYEGDLNLRETPVLANRTAQYAFVPVGSPLPANPAKVHETTYLIADPAYAASKDYYVVRNMIGLVTASQVKDGADVVVSRSETVYDGALIISAGTAAGWQDPGTVHRGYPTSTRVWDSTKGGATNASAYIATNAQFDNFGNQRKAWDAKGNLTETSYASPPGQDYKFAFPTQVTSPIPSDGVHGSNSAFVTTATFDAATGLPLTTTDANGLETRIAYDPVTLRPQNTKTYYNSVQVGSTAETVYHDEPGNYWVKNRAQIDEGRWAESITYFDGLGRAWKTEEINSKGSIFVEKEFDADGRVLRVSNPFRSGETKVWTTNVYDEASRVKEVILQDGATVKTDYGVSVSGAVGVTKQITDQAGKKRKGISDALGRMVRVIEDPAGQNLNTDYVFDTLGNLRKTIQGEQNRFFMHDSLGRLLFAKQPEQDANGAFIATDPVTGNTAWSVKYEFDDNGNITKTTDGRGIYIQGNYDNFNRLKVRDYSDPNTPDVSFYYDGKGLGSEPARSKGKTTKVTSAVSETRYTSFDDLGRLLTHEQRTDGQTYATGYAYNLSGGLIKETYPSLREVHHEINADGDLARVWGQKGSAVATYANAFSYNVSGAIEKMRLGNGRWETAVYNERLQIEQIGLGTGSGSQNLLKLELDYGTAAQNNGNLREQKITVPSAQGATGFTATQTYVYDDLNRLQSATEHIAGQTPPSWKQTFEIDRYGNREFDAANTTTITGCAAAICDPEIGTSRNRFSDGQGYGYDQNGNLTQDAKGQRFGYDAENHQKEFFATGNGTSIADATYHYDGEGRRIKKIAGAETTIFVYNASGQLVAEYSTQTAQAPQTSYLTTDHLGSARVVTDQLGVVTDRKDFGAFGDETATPERVVGLGYNAADPTRKGYTGYEKDGESSLEFAQARYYNTTHGRYTSVDPLTASASIKNPQTFNRYTYVLNSPYNFVDPLGLRPSDVGTASWGYCGASYSSCEGDYFWGQAVFAESPPAPRQEETDEGVAEDQGIESGDQMEALEPEPPPLPGDAKIELTGIQIVTDIPKVDKNGVEDMETTKVLATGDPNGAVGPELNLAGAQDDLNRGNTPYLRLTLKVTGDSRASFLPADLTQTKVPPILVGSGFEDTVIKGVATKPVIRLSEDGKTLVAYVGINSSDRQLRDLPKSIAVRANAFYRDAFVNGTRPGEFNTNVPVKVPGKFRIRLYNAPPKSIF